ncbi:MAG: alpha/beta hydrolase [Kangiellaceae bacterium]|nr:alpha/beta hydrolase [Kangiellaceae bacterium]
MKACNQQIILLHGLGRSPRSMRKLERALKNQGYRVLNAGYPGVSKGYQEILTGLLSTLNQWIDASLPVHFIGHSFGGILIRGLLAESPQWNIGRCVMLGSPNKGTATATYMLNHPVLKYFTPKVTHDLTPDSELIRHLPEPSIETGIIAGDQPSSILVPVTWFYKTATNNAPGDGVVELYNTQCRKMSDFIVLPLHHSFMMWDSQLIEQVIHFLQYARFSHQDE